MFDTLLLRSFVTVAQEGSFTRAATRLNLTQSAVSAHLRRLEEQAGAPLFTRTTRSIALTHDGEVLLGYARAILALNRDAHARLHRSADAGLVRIGLSHDFAQPRVMQRLHAFGLRHPGLVVELTVGIPGALLLAMDRGEIDFVLGGRCHDERPGRALWREQLVWVAASWLAIDRALPLPLAVFPEPCPYRESALAALAHADIDYRITVVCPSVSGLYSAVQAGLGITPVPKSLVDDTLAIVGDRIGLPALPDVEFALFGAPNPAPLVDELCEAARRDLR